LIKAVNPETIYGRKRRQTIVGPHDINDLCCEKNDDKAIHSKHKHGPKKSTTLPTKPKTAPAVAAKRSKLVKKRTVVDEHGLEVQNPGNFIYKEQAIHTHKVGEEGDLYDKEADTSLSKFKGRNMREMWGKALDINNLRKLKRAQTKE